MTSKASVLGFDLLRLDAVQGLRANTRAKQSRCEHLATQEIQPQSHISDSGSYHSHTTSEDPNFKQMPGRPDKSEWWNCCQCCAMVNPRINGDLCPVCAHCKCDWYCTNL
ncbi:uncharacterized protein LY89DRAFT_680196 [Mollisia scopiformis]|uniref:Uncharacterized protein n=1 Tax=Mollisia scopiformis TaxID=149040 RepID=A0A194XUQ9_MOLSC|nr:uncharacterized protein LY89DRAFT_680196 [Mollisia scopiformis]KUJ23442.1 hypothetical protein LY89DRAFT_680196 [Mollisia scopiformis]